MKKTTRAESFIGIMIGVFLISIVILGISNLLNYSWEVIREYEDNTKITILRHNINNIVKNTDTSHISEDEFFYIYNDEDQDIYRALSGSVNEGYKYINEFWQYIADPNTYDGPVYSRQLLLEREDTSVWEQNQVIKVSIKRLIKKDP